MKWEQEPRKKTLLIKIYPNKLLKNQSLFVCASEWIKHSNRAVEDSYKLELNIENMKETYKVCIFITEITEDDQLRRNEKGKK